MCVSNALHFPVEITPLGTKPSNCGHSVPGPELGLHSPVCSGLEGLPYQSPGRCFVLRPVKRLFMPVVDVFVPNSCGALTLSPVKGSIAA